MLIRAQQKVASPSCCQIAHWKGLLVGSSLNRPARFLHSDHRARLSKCFIPGGGVTVKDAKQDEDSHSKLVRAGFLRQAHAGVFHMLPLGLRVVDKLKRVIDRHMELLGASKVSLSTFSSPHLWKKSQRWQKAGPELFTLLDRKKSPLLLSPTHEEEITSLVKQTVMSFKDLPLRLYQITRKYRDEVRPRKGLLRSREFVMKDLYTFDLSAERALATYNLVRAAYDRIFSEIELPVRVAEASSGDIGGDLSHEYHLPVANGEDDLVSCRKCKYIANSEVAKIGAHSVVQAGKPAVWRGISKDRLTLVNVWYPETAYSGPLSPEATYADEDVNIHSVKTLVPDLDGSVESAESLSLVWWDAMQAWRSPEGVADGDEEIRTATKVPRLVNIVDFRLGDSISEKLAQNDLDLPITPFAPEALSKLSIPAPQIMSCSPEGGSLNLMSVRDGDPCPQCKHGELRVEKAIELGHTFHLGTRYSEPMGASLKLSPAALNETRALCETLALRPGSADRVIMQMGCHGIGVSRIIGAVAEHLADDKGLNWPRAIAPYEVIIVADKTATADGSAESFYDLLSTPPPESPEIDPSSSVQPASSTASRGPLDLLIDDRDKPLPWKLKDADLVGYPVIVVLGSAWAKDGQCEVQCRRRQFNKTVPTGDLVSVVNGLLNEL